MGLFTQMEKLVGKDVMKYDAPYRVHEKRTSQNKGPEKPEKTAEQLALEKRQQVQLDKETAENERRLKQMARGKLGAESLLGGTEPTQQQMVSRGGSGGGAGAGSLLGAAATGGGGGSSAANRPSRVATTGKAK